MIAIRDRLEVPLDLRGCHPLIAKTRQALEHQEPNEHQLVYATGEGMLHVHVSPNSVVRALRILAAIIRNSEANGWKVEPTGKEGKSRICIDEDPVSFSIFEKTQRFELETTKEEKEGSWSPRYRYKATGLLTLQISEYLPDTIQRSWSDGRRQQLEDVLDEFIEGIERASRALRARRLAQEEWHRRCRTAPSRRERFAFRTENEPERTEDLLKQSTDWARTDALRKFIAEVRQRSAKEPSLWPSEAVTRWLRWAETMVRRLDPFENGCFRRVLKDSETNQHSPTS